MAAWEQAGTPSQRNADDAAQVQAASVAKGDGWEA